MLNDFYIQRVIQKIYELVPGQKIKTSKGINFRCPVCGDSSLSKKKKRAWFFPQDGFYHCYNGGCEVHWSALKFLSFLEQKSITEIKKEVLYDNKNVKNLFDILTEDTKIPEEFQSEPEKVQVKDDFEYPSTWVDLEKNETALRFIQDRKILEAPFIPKNWKLFYDTKYKKIIIPWIRDGKIVSYQYRTLVSNDPNKYMFPVDTHKDIFGFDNIDIDFEYLFLIEGVFDTIWVKNGICIGSTTLSEFQENLLEPYYLSHKIVYMLDNFRVDKTSKKKYEKIVFKDKNALIFNWDKSITSKDVNDYVLQEGKNPFADKNYLRSRIISGPKALLELKFF
jgi:hypothetical protein